MAILKIRDSNGNVQEIIALKGDNYNLTFEDKHQIAAIVATEMFPNVSALSDGNFITEEEALALIEANIPASGDEESY